MKYKTRYNSKKRTWTIIIKNLTIKQLDKILGYDKEYKKLNKEDQK